MRKYSLYQSRLGQPLLADIVEADGDRQALRLARQLLTNAPGELRLDGRIVCRFG